MSCSASRLAVTLVTNKVIHLHYRVASDYRFFLRSNSKQTAGRIYSLVSPMQLLNVERDA